MNEHLPDRWYSECQFHEFPDAVWPDPDECSEEEYERAQEYEDNFWETHFYTSDGDFIACDDSFIGLGCSVCSFLYDTYVSWPCDEAVINDQIINSVLQNSQKALPTRADTLA